MILINGVAALMAVCFLYLAAQNAYESSRNRKMQQEENAKAALGMPYSDLKEAICNRNKRTYLYKAAGCLGNVLVWVLVFWVAL